MISNIPSYIKASNAKIMMTFNIKSNSFGFGYTWSYGVFIEQPEGNAKIFFCCHHLMLDISKPPLCLCQKITPWNIWNRFDCITTFSAQNVSHWPKFSKAILQFQIVSRKLKKTIEDINYAFIYWIPLKISFLKEVSSPKTALEPFYWTLNAWWWHHINFIFNSLHKR